jgi:hypothetical protein
MTKDESEGFKITDKRSFREDGGPRAEELGKEPPKDSPKEPPSDPFKVVDSSGASNEAPPGTGAKIDFPSYILSYYTQGLVLLGEVPNPYTNQKEEDAEGARHTVEILTMLQEKTRGNLSKEEEQLLEGVLYELRMKFMAKTSRIKL